MRQQRAEVLLSFIEKCLDSLVEPRSPTLEADALTSEPPGKPSTLRPPLSSCSNLCPLAFKSPKTVSRQGYNQPIKDLCSKPTDVGKKKKDGWRRGLVVEYATFHIAGHPRFSFLP